MTTSYERKDCTIQNDRLPVKVSRFLEDVLIHVPKRFCRRTHLRVVNDFVKHTQKNILHTSDIFFSGGRLAAREDKGEHPFDANRRSSCFSCNERKLQSIISLCRITFKQTAGDNPIDLDPTRADCRLPFFFFFFFLGNIRHLLIHPLSHNILDLLLSSVTYRL